MEKKTIKRLDIPGLHYEYSNASTTPVYHYHDFYEIYFMHSGENMYFIKDKSFRLKENDMMFIDRNVLHKPGYLTGSYTRSFFYIKDGLSDETSLQALKSLCSIRAYTPEDPQFVQKIIYNIQQEIIKQDCISDALVKSYLLELIAYCFRHKSRYIENDLQHPVIERLVRHINNCYNENITLFDSAKNLNMSESYLSRLFKSITGFSFKEYLIAVRIKHAKELLSASKKSVKQIAFECGFNDSNYFSKLFKDETGISPLKYRQNTDS